MLQAFIMLNKVSTVGILNLYFVARFDLLNEVLSMPDATANLDMDILFALAIASMVPQMFACCVSVG